MSLILIDTDIASFILKESHYLASYKSVLEGNQLALSFMTVAELFQWAFVRRWGDRRREQLERYFSGYLVIPVDYQLCQKWAAVRAQRQHQGKPISPQDAWIAATALRHDLPLVTHNIRDFQDIYNLSLLPSDSPKGR